MAVWKVSSYNGSSPITETNSYSGTDPVSEATSYSGANPGHMSAFYGGRNPVESDTGLEGYLTDDDSTHIVDDDGAKLILE